MPSGVCRLADGIVALTGDEGQDFRGRTPARRRERQALAYFGREQEHAGRLEIINLNTAGGNEARLFRCCVDLDKRALNTEANAFETTAWVRQQGFRSLIVVTSNYHMPRTLIELRQAMPDVELLPYPVKVAASRGAMVERSADGMGSWQGVSQIHHSLRALRRQFPAGRARKG